MNLVENLSQVVDHFFPKLNEWMSLIKDHRHPLLITYHKKTLIWCVLMMYLTRRGARRQITEEMREGNCFKGIKQFSEQMRLNQVPHGDTVEYYFQKTDLEDFEELNRKIVHRLIRMRAIEGCRLQGHYLVAIDGIHICTFDYEHCPNCIKRKHKSGKIQWQHYKVQASLITPNGLCLPMASVWIENEEFYEKQDCEYKGAKRLLKKLRKMYPQLKMCILMDSLYANEPIFTAIEELKMEWIVVFKEGRMPEVYEWIKKMMTKHGLKKELEMSCSSEIKARGKRDHQQRCEREIVAGGTREQKIERMYTWGNEIGHWQNERSYNILSSKVTVDGKFTSQYTWLVSSGIKVEEKTVNKVSQAGRCRWKIENEGINVQKNGGYKLEHLYSRDEVSMKIWIVLLDIAHIISQLLEKGSLLEKEIFGSSQNLAKRLYEHLRYFVFRKPKQWPRRQIRLFHKCVRFGWDTS
jgi:hypothetical protein